MEVRCSQGKHLYEGRRVRVDERIFHGATVPPYSAVLTGFEEDKLGTVLVLRDESGGRCRRARPFQVHGLGAKR